MSAVRAEPPMGLRSMRVTRWRFYPHGLGNGTSRVEFDVMALAVCETEAAKGVALVTGNGQHRCGIQAAAGEDDGNIIFIHG